MKVYLLADIEGVGIKGEVVKVKEGYADNFLIPRKMGIKITTKNAAFYEEHSKHVDHRKEVISSKTSMLAEKIKGIKLALKRKMHDDGKLYASVNSSEVAELLGKEGVNVSKSQVKMDKSIKEKGVFSITVKLTSKIQSKVELKVVGE